LSRITATAVLGRSSLANHGFHNDTTPRYDEAAAKLAWWMDWLNKYLRAPNSA
jgi:dienelactone hydrolase